MKHAEYLRCDATALAALVRRGEVSADELLTLALAQLDRVQPQLNAVVHRFEARARAQVAAASGAWRGPLAGVPMLLKDGLQHLAGEPTLAGCRAALRLPVPTRHAAVTRRLLDAGCVVFGKTNLPELGLKGVSDSALHGPVCNPWDLSRNAGGSSGGAAAAVAAGVLPMAAGSDGGGSLRIPAAWCGLFTLKPSRGRISEAPELGEVWFGACTHGVITRSVRDCALALDVLAGPEPGDPIVCAPPSVVWTDVGARPLRRLRIGMSTASPVGAPVHAQAVAAVQRAATLLRDLGHEVVESAPAIDGRALARAYLAMYLGQVPAEVALLRAAGARSGEFELLTRAMEVLGRASSAAALTAELARWNDFARTLGDWFGRHDLLLTPTTAVEPLPQGATDLPRGQALALDAVVRSGLLGLLARRGWIDGVVDAVAHENLAPVPFTQLANLTGTPAMSVPLHHTPSGLPMGVQFMAPIGDEATLLQLAAQLEQAAPWFDRLPALASGDAAAPGLRPS